MRTFVVWLAASVIIWLGASAVGSAQGEGAPTFNVGDRVECAPVGTTFVPGTIIGVERSVYPGAPPSAYRVRLDNGQVCNIYNRKERFRPATGAAVNAPPPRQTTTVHVATNGTVLPARPCLDCLNLQSPPGRNGDRPPMEAIKKLMRCALYEHNAEPGQDGATGVDIERVEVGGSRPWQRSDHGEGSYGTIVWPMQVTFKRTTWYRTRTRIEKHEWPFTVFVNKMGKWYVQTTAGSRKDWPEQSIPVD